MSNQQKNIDRWPKRWRELLEKQPWSSPPVKRVKSPALQYLLMIQWHSGNGQCCECWGVSPLWLGDFRYPVIDYCGHAPGCVLAAAIADAGGEVLYWKVPERERELGKLEEVSDEDRKAWDETWEKALADAFSKAIET